MSDNLSITIGDLPRFCPDCGWAADASSDGSLCRHCGSTLAIQGYCPICEARIRRRVGGLCPKHEVELLADEPGPRSGFENGSVIAWVTVQRFPDTLAAAAARIRLDAEGIPTFLEGERMGAPAMYRVATGGVKLQVPAELATDARIILSQDWSWPDDDLGHDDDPDPGEEEHVPPDGSSAWALALEAIVVLVLAIPLLAALLAYLRAG